MVKEKTECCETNKWQKTKVSAGTGAVYCLGFIGAVVYYIQVAPTFLEGVIGFFKALVWPAILVYKLLLVIN
jgi:hypothetical protein